MILILRTTLLFSFALISIRLMGKRQIGELQPYEFIVTMIVSELAVLPIEDPKTPIIYSLLPLITVLTLQLAISAISLKSLKFREFLCGKPSLLIKNGRFHMSNMQSELITTTDLLSQLRCAGVQKISDINWAIMESNGQVNTYDTAAYPTELIIDGVVVEESLKIFDKTKDWLLERLKGHGITDTSSIFICTMEPDGSLFVQEKIKEHE